LGLRLQSVVIPYFLEELQDLKKVRKIPEKYLDLLCFLKKILFDFIPFRKKLILFPLRFKN